MNTEHDWSLRVAAAVRAEIAWHQRDPEELGEVLHLADRRSIAARLNGETSFDLAEVQKVAGWLGLTTSELLTLAERGLVAASEKAAS